MTANHVEPDGSSPLLVVISGPSGVGKDAVVSRMRERGRRYHFAVTATTRPRRDQEEDGVDYFFVSEGSFRRMDRDGELLEWAEVYGNLYGVPKRQIIEALDNGTDVIVKTDVQGAATIRKLAPQAILIFLAPPSVEELASRLRRRKSESPDDLELRLRTAEAEMEEAPEFDHVVTNHRDRLDATVDEIDGIVSAERHQRRSRSAPSL